MASPFKREALTGLRFGYLGEDPANMALAELDANPRFLQVLFY